MPSFTMRVGVIALACLLGQSAGLAAGGVVGSGSAASCTEAAFDTIFLNAQNSGGGVITFNCGPDPAVIVFTTMKSVATATEIRGGDRITLSGGNAVGLFQVSATRSLKVGNIVLTHAFGINGAIENSAR